MFSGLLFLKLTLSEKIEKKTNCCYDDNTFLHLFEEIDHCPTFIFSILGDYFQCS